MRIITHLLIVLALILFVLNILFWILLHGSGHKVPPETDETIYNWCLVLLLFLAILFYGKYKNKV
jgi:uncharacterized membrane protein